MNLNEEPNEPDEPREPLLTHPPRCKVSSAMNPTQPALYWCSLALVVAGTLGGVAVIGEQAAPASGAKPAAQTRLTPADAAAYAKEVRQKVNVEMPPGIDVTLWASERLVTDPI